MRSLLLITLAVCSFYAHANLWDNYFFEDALDFTLPDEFYMKMSSDLQYSKIILEIKSSKSLNKTYFSQQVDINGINISPTLKKALNIESYAVFNTRAIYTHSILQKQCSKYELKNNSVNYVDRLNGALKIASLVLDREKVGDLYEVNADDILKEQFGIYDQRVKIYYDKESHFKKFTIFHQNQQVATFNVDELRSQEYKEEELTVPDDWKCYGDNVKVYNSTDTEQVVKKIASMRPDNFNVASLLANLPLDQIPDDVKGELLKLFLEMQKQGFKFPGFGK